jgi:hypothetical protein
MSSLNDCEAVLRLVHASPRCGRLRIARIKTNLEATNADTSSTLSLLLAHRVISLPLWE